MLAKLRPKLTYANVVSTLCLFILLGGSSYAAVTLKKDSVKNKNIAPNAVTSPKVKNGSLLAQDFKAGQLPVGAAGPKGDSGAAGLKGDTGSPGTNGTSVTSANEPAGTNCANGGSKFTSASGVAYACNGAQGARGPSDAYYTAPDPVTGTGTSTLSLPAGSFVVNGKAMGNNNSSSNVGFRCELTRGSGPPGNQLDVANTVLGATGQPSAQAVNATQVAITLASPDTIIQTCSGATGVQQQKLTAVQVGAIH